MYAFFFMLWERDWEEPGYLKFLKALQEDTKNFSHLIPMNTVRIYMQHRGTLYPRVKWPPALPLHPPPPNKNLMYAFSYDKRDWEEPGYLKFLKALQEDTGNNFSYLVPVDTARIYLQQRGTLYPGVITQVIVSHPTVQPKGTL